MHCNLQSFTFFPFSLSYFVQQQHNVTKEENWWTISFDYLKFMCSLHWLHVCKWMHESVIRTIAEQKMINSVEYFVVYRSKTVAHFNLIHNVFNETLMVWLSWTERIKQNFFSTLSVYNTHDVYVSNCDVILINNFYCCVYINAFLILVHIAESIRLYDVIEVWKKNDVMFHCQCQI